MIQETINKLSEKINEKIKKREFEFIKREFLPNAKIIYGKIIIENAEFNIICYKDGTFSGYNNIFHIDINKEEQKKLSKYLYEKLLETTIKENKENEKNIKKIIESFDE